MKYKGGKSWYDKNSNEWKSQPRIYTDFYCSLSEWANLGRGKPNFMYQVRSAIVDILGYPEDKKTELEKIKVSRDEYKFTLSNGLVVNKLSFDRGGRRDSLEGEKYSAWIIKNAIKLITHRESIVEFYSWKGTINHIEITFPDATMPNIIVLVDEYSVSSTNRTLIDCIDAIYDTLKAKTHECYDNYLSCYYNDNYDMVYYKSTEDATGEYLWAKGKWMWKEIIYPKNRRQYDHYGTLSYK